MMIWRRRAGIATTLGGTPEGRRRASAALLFSGAAVILTGCGLTTGTVAAPHSTAPTTTDMTESGPTADRVGAASSDPAQTTAAAPTDTGAIDSVQADPTPTSSALVLTSAQYSTAARGLQVSAFVQGLIETDGTCRANAAHPGAATLTGSPVDAEAGPSTTDCIALTLPLPAGSSGSWQVWVTYSSPRAHLTSAKTTVRVP